MAALNGLWALTSGVSKGESMPEATVNTIRLALRSGKYSVRVGNQVDQGTYTIDASKTPKTLTLEGTSGPNKGKKMLAIYELEKETLKVCYDTSGKAFPEKFESKPDTASFLATYKKSASRSAKRPLRSNDADTAP
jgi:uncharacterized protein (TIGR03067 family)